MCSSAAELVVAFAITVVSVKKQDKLQVLWWRLGHARVSRSRFLNFLLAHR